MKDLETADTVPPEETSEHCERCNGTGWRECAGCWVGIGCSVEENGCPCDECDGSGE